MDKNDFLRDCIYKGLATVFINVWILFSFGISDDARRYKEPHIILAVICFQPFLCLF